MKLFIKTRKIIILLSMVFILTACANEFSELQNADITYPYENNHGMISKMVKSEPLKNNPSLVNIRMIIELFDEIATVTIINETTYPLITGDNAFVEFFDGDYWYIIPGLGTRRDSDIGYSIAPYGYSWENVFGMELHEVPEHWLEPNHPSLFGIPPYHMVLTVYLTNDRLPLAIRPHINLESGLYRVRSDVIMIDREPRPQLPHEVVVEFYWDGK